MNKQFNLITVTLLVIFAAIIFTGCNTWHGAGKDVENAGESMQGH